MEIQHSINYDSFKPHTKYLQKSYFMASVSTFFVLVPLVPFSFAIPFFVDAIAPTFIVDWLEVNRWIVVAGILVFIGTMLTLFAKLHYNALEYQISTSEILIKSGVIFKRQIVIPLRTVTNIDMIIGPIDRIFGLGTVNIQTAGSVSILAEGRFVGLLQVDAENLRDRIKEQLQKFQGSPGTAIDNVGQTNGEVEVVIGELKSIRKVLEEIRDRK